jgi:hypothetical protein
MMSMVDATVIKTRAARDHVGLIAPAWHLSLQVQNPQLVAILQQLLLSDNDAVQNAQSQLKKFMKQPDSLTSLATILTANPDDGVRQMAATLLRQRITKSWIRVAADAKAYIKHTLLTCVISDKSYAMCLGLRD